MSSLTDLYKQELNSLSQDDFLRVKQAGWLLPATAAAGIGFAGGYLYGGPSSADKEKARQEAIKNNLMAAAAGAGTALMVRKPVEGLLQPDPEDLQVMEADAFDDLWKQRVRRR
jgi:hypothetical protein